LKIRIEQVRTEKHFNPRAAVDSHEVTALSSSMRTKIGQVAPIILRQGDNELIDGLHRLRAAQRAGQHDLEAVTVKAGDEEAREMALAANSLTARLNWLERGRAVCQILDSIKWRGGREKKKMELEKQLGLSHHILEADVTAFRLLDPEAWKICLVMSKNHLLSREQIARTWQLPHEQQLVLLRRVQGMKNRLEIANQVEGFLETQRVERNWRGRPRGSGTSTAHVESSAAEKSTAPQSRESHQNSSVKPSKREATEEKLQEALRMDPVNIADLEIWKLARQLKPRLRRYARLHCERWKITEALRKDIEVLEAKAETPERRMLTVPQSRT
jgi:ParB/RepB/Spo0J family partition protein